MFEENFVPLKPISFFQLQFNSAYLPSKAADKELKGSSYKIPDTTLLCGEEPFGELYMGWNKEGLHFFAIIGLPFKDVFYPEVGRGDSLELFIDTRDVKTSGFNTKFCHHFFFLPQEYEGIKAGEITRFRTEDAHELCDPKELHLQSEMHKKGYSLRIFIPAHCLVGYDPDQFNRLGFTYRLNRCAGSPQHLSQVTDQFAIEQQPSLWSSVFLKP